MAEVASTEPPDATAPSIPAGLTVTGATSSAIGISWTASTDAVGVAGYHVFHDGVEVGTTANTSFTDNGLLAETPYSYTVTAFDAATNESAASASLDVTTTAPTPTIETDPDLLVAVIGNVGTDLNAVDVLELVRDEGADLVIHNGNLDYGDDPAAFEAQIDSILGSDFPYFVTPGVRDLAEWSGAGGYQDVFEARAASTPGASCVGDYGVNSTCEYGGLVFALSGVGTTGAGHADYISDQFADDDHTWRLCGWSKNQMDMQIGARADETGWEVYEACRENGAIVTTGHAYTYSRTRTLTDMENQIVSTTSPDADDLLVAPGSTFTAVSGIGGYSIRPQARCFPTTAPFGCNGEWAAISTSDQGADFGALFLEFNVGGNPRAAQGYFKEVDDDIVDSFDVVSGNSAPAVVDETFVAFGSDWRYLDDDVEQAGWTETAFDDTGWSVGPAELGYGDGDEATVVSFGPNSGDKYTTTWFRQAFEVADPSVVGDLEFEVYRDDGLVVHVNGVEVFRDNMPGGPIDKDTFSAETINTADERTPVTITVPSSELIGGTNVIAAEVHQANLGSSDLSFDLEMRAPVGASNPDVTAPSVPENVLAVSVLDSSVSLVWDASSDDVGPVTYDVLRDGVAVVSGLSVTSFTDATGLSASTGYSYEVVARDGVGNFSTSAPVGVTTAASVSTETLIDFGADWSYLDSGSLESGWETSGFDDSVWMVGPAPLGYSNGVTTTVSFGSDSNNKYISTWFRHEFEVADPAAVGELLFEIVRDDGPVVYVNGVEVFRDNLPAGPIDANTLAPVPIGDADETTPVPFSVPAGLLVAGTNVIAVEMHQNAPTSSDLGFDLRLVADVASDVVLETVVPFGSTWSYLDSGAFESGWETTGFDDSVWSSGPARLGYGGDGEVTLIDFGGDTGNKYTTTWFRHEFDVADLAGVGDLRFGLVRDDGAVVYVNGVEVFRENMPAGPILPTTFALGAISAPEETTPVPFTVPSSVLVTGTNVIAVEVHQNNLTSSDLGFDLELVVPVTPVVADTTAPSVPVNVLVTAVSDVSVSLVWDASTDDTGVAGYRVFRDGVDVGTTSELVFTDGGLDAETTYSYTVSAFDLLPPRMSRLSRLRLRRRRMRRRM